MYNSNIILQIQATYNQLTKAEKKVAITCYRIKKKSYTCLSRIWQMPVR